MASIESKLKITLFGKSGRPVKSLKTAKSYTLHYGKKLVVKKQLRQKTPKKKQEAIEKIYAETFSFLFFQDVLSRQDKQIAKQQYEQEQKEIKKSVTKKEQQYLKTTTSTKRKHLEYRRLGIFYNLKKQSIDLKKPIPINLTNKPMSIKLIKNIFSPAIRKFVLEHFEKCEKEYYVRIKLTHKLSKKDFTIKKRINRRSVQIKTNEINRGVSVTRKEISNIPNTLEHLNTVFDVLDLKLDEYLSRKFTTNIYVTGMDIEVIESFD